MGIYTVEPKDFITVIDDNNEHQVLSINKAKKFNSDILGLGDISIKSKQRCAIAIIFDLSGFTDFCNQIDPQLTIPEFLSEFLKWIFREIKSEMTSKTVTEGIQLWADLPFMAKFMGDGILLLWDTEKMTPHNIHNVVGVLNEICKNYQSVFLPIIKNIVGNPPLSLRCGIARGQIYSVGDGKDYVGSCINMASRLQKLGSLTFCFSRRGFKPEECMDKNVMSQFVLKSTEIRGIGDNELVFVRKEEFEALSTKEKEIFSDPNA